MYDNCNGAGKCKDTVQPHRTVQNYSTIHRFEIKFLSCSIEKNPDYHIYSEVYFN